MRDIPPVAKAWPSAVWLERPWPRDTLDAEEGTRIKAAYSDNFGRLVALKNKYDPTNLFRLNQNIRPAL